MRSIFGTTIFVCCLLVVFAFPPRPRFDTESLCQTFRSKCEAKEGQKDCKARAEECVKYAENGLNVTWSFSSQEVDIHNIVQKLILPDLDCEIFLNRNSKPIILGNQCMYSNNDDLEICNERIKVDYDIIADQVHKGTFQYEE